ncbi:hypothetical protein [Acinetobacter shaoyimingii]|uniref:Uncharacterized protein n=1 Tax=Acinetobacter shaoyimingii TaxID=2715164 RepID=A0A6G8RWA4_9GAMM|nr:hypothetical protein [Acinetobacter shaoyimingii]QIO06141.1 hypothetical protein G8E00_09315 [Acinetobacter shaoyimingii]
MAKQIKNHIQPDWISKTIAGGVLGLSFSVAIANLLVLFGKDYLELSLIRQFGMWTIPWLWMTIFFATYFIPKGKTALYIFVVANVIAYVLLFSFRGQSA